MDKSKLREKLLAKRRSISEKHIEKASEAIFEKVISHRLLTEAQSIMLYSDFDNEVRTGKLAGWLMYMGKDVYLPLVYKKEMFAANMKKATLELSGFGTLQPQRKGANLIEPGELNLVIVPGIAFDKEFNRVGYGAGYYDVFLKEAKNAGRMALAYDFQLVRAIEAEGHDEKMDVIVTPDRVLG